MRVQTILRTLDTESLICQLVYLPNYRRVYLVEVLADKPQNSSYTWFNDLDEAKEHLDQVIEDYYVTN